MKGMTKWMEEIGPEGDIVISSRIRLARNIEDYPFPIALIKSKSKEVISRVKESVENSSETMQGEFSLQELDNVEGLDRQVMMEKHLISPNLISNADKAAVLTNKDESISIMINEEDHIRIQCLLPGLQLDETWGLADKIDNLLEERIRYAFHEKLGYLTSCPTNVGTGIRASVMVHLPALTMTSYINRILQAASQIGLAIRGIYGEGTEFAGNVFQISNQLTLGRTEKEIISNLKDVSRQIIQKERDARETLRDNNKLQLEDKIFRSFGILTNARILTSQEAMKLLSDVRLGIDMGIIKNVSGKSLNQIMVMMQPAFLQKEANKALSANERDVRRASLVREKIGDN